MMSIYEKIEKYLSKDKVNYDTEMTKLVEAWKKEGKRPNVLLHSCCAPCSTYSLEYLSQDADITLYYYNPNIYPKSEYDRRALVQKKFINDFNKKTGNQVEFLEAAFEPKKFMDMVLESGLESQREGGRRCTACFNLRLDGVARIANEMGFDYFGTALTLSPHKNSQIINAVGFEVQEIYNTKFLPADFKKKGGFFRSVEMCEEYDVYRQCYCGCIFAAKDQGVDLKEVNKEALAFLKESKSKLD